MDVCSRSVWRYVKSGAVGGHCMFLWRYSAQFSYLQLICYIGLKWSLSCEILQYPLPYLPFLCICIQVNQDISNGIRHLWLWIWILSLCLMTLQISLRLYWLLWLPWIVTKFCAHKHENGGSKCWLNLTFSFQYGENAPLASSTDFQDGIVFSLLVVLVSLELQVTDLN